MYRTISSRAFSLWAFMAGLEGFLAAFFLAREPSEAESVFAFGLSSQRLTIIAGVLLLSLIFVVIAIAHSFRLLTWNEAINERPKSIRYLLAGVFILDLVVVHVLFLLPDYHFPALLGYLPRLKPVLVWLALLFAQTFVFLAYFEGISLKNFTGWRKNIAVMIVLFIIGLFWGLVALTRIGIIPDDVYWNETGVPILTGQIWIAIVITLVAWFLHNRFVAKVSDARMSSFAVFMGIWILAAIIWIKTPLRPTFNAPGPYPPSGGYYPFVDAALFDLGAQSAIYGKGLFFGTFLDRGLLSGFLALIHRIFGQNYAVVVSVQSGVYAVFPALLFFLGKKVHSTSAGIMVATLAILKVSNAITAGRLIGTSHPKLLLTEFPTGVVLVLISFFLVTWLRENHSRASHLAGVGASLGIGILLRHNVLFMFLAMILMGFVFWKQHLKIMIRDMLIVMAAFFITISPWMWRNQRVAGEPLFFLAHFNRVIEERYQTESSLEQKKVVLNTFPIAMETHLTLSGTENINFLDLAQYQFIPKHFVHNIITSVLILPPSPVIDDLRHVLDEYPYWGRLGNSSLEDISISMGMFLAANFVILSIGIGTAWKRVKFAAFVPLMVFLFYNLANAFARTSGGRYIVPVDWVIYFYYAIGLVEIIRFCIAAMGFQANGFFEQFGQVRQDHGSASVCWSRAGPVVLPFFLIVAMLPVIEFASPGEKPPESTDSLLERLDENSFFEQSELSRREVEGFLGSPDALLISGRGLYPRYYSFEEGESILPGNITPYTPREFPRLVFTLLLPDIHRPVVLPIDNPSLQFPDAAEVIVGGCRVEQIPGPDPYLNYIDAAFVIILDDTTLVYVRGPEAPLACPLREPVCDNNHNCN